MPRWVLLASIALITAAVYMSTLGYDFVYDDHAQIVETKQLNSWRMVPHYFTGHVWSWKSPGSQGPYYRPVFLLWLLFNQTLFGTIPLWWHLTSVLTHCAVALLVFVLMDRLTGDPVTASIAALFFGVHPCHIESVAWVSGITDPLMAAFMLGSLLTRRRWLSLVLFAAALMEKESAIILPVLVVLMRGQAKPPAPPFAYGAVALIYLGVRQAVMHGFMLVISPVPLWQMVATWPAMLFFYLKHLVWPSGLTVFYTLGVVNRPDYLDVMVLLAVAIGLSFWCWKSRVAAFAMAMLVLPILPVLNIRAFAHFETVHDRYLYVPSIGFCMLAALALEYVRDRRAQLGVAAIVMLGFAYGTVTQEQQWENNVTLFQRGIHMSPNNEIANQGMGTALMLRNQPADAIPYYRRALELQPNMFESNYSLGRAYEAVGMCNEGEPYLLRASQLNPRDSKTVLYYGVCQYNLGQLKAAEATLRQAIRMKGPDDYREYHLYLGLVLEKKGDLDAARAEFESEARENPDPSRALSEISRLKR
ncbi:MAG TPA: tetratricopeptide repeat protein [Bryobacteraceae bacterium]|nr:tetratricopeptide repeat protein [Bryobacteraceae bacterium]